MRDWADAIGVPHGVVTTLAIALVAMIAGTIIRLATISPDSAQGRSRLGSLATWWTLLIAFGGALLLGRAATALFFALAAFLGIREFLALTFETRRDRVGDFLASVAVPVQFLLAAHDAAWSALFLPVAFFLALPVRMMLTGSTTGYIHDAGSVFWGVMLLGFALSHVVLFAAAPEALIDGSWCGLILYLVLLTETNDIAQALWGRRIGRHKVTPTISPNKTWEGLVFGMATTVAAGVGLSRLLTPLEPLAAAGGSLVIAAGGFLGDINMSAVKRDIGVKDSSALLPGQGGALDRIDSLCFSAPLFYYYYGFIHATAGG
ncbi:MAG: phosphatidate cytidylyltransferase [Planctomycetes bacterium]|nr:phosphatidate cytidylyltransferase [Planctomycetota bacterium]